MAGTLMMLAGLCLLPAVEMGGRALSSAEMKQCYDEPAWNFLGTDCITWECSTNIMGETIVPPDASYTIHKLSRDTFILPCWCSMFVNWYGWTVAKNKLNFTVNNERLATIYPEQVETSSSYGFGDFDGPHYHFWEDEKLRDMYWKFQNTLNLSIADEKVNGSYTCGGWLEPTAVVINLNFYDDLPTVVKTVNESDFGNPLMMECAHMELEANHLLLIDIPPIFNWGTPLSEEWNKLFSDDSSYRYEEQKKKLTINSLARSNLGTYICSITSEEDGQTVRAHQRYEIQGAPLLTTPNNETLIGFSIGESFSLYCPIDGFPRPEIKWFKDKEMINNGDDSRIVIESNNGTKDGALKFTGFVKEDEAFYVCKGGNKVEPNPVVYTIELKENYGPVITTTSDNMFQSLVGETMMYTCPIDGVPEPTFTWYKNRTKVPTDARTSFPGRAIKIVNFTKEDGDEYTCIGENEFEPLNASYTVEIVAQYAPVVLAPNNETVTESNVGSNQTLLCPIDGYPLPVFTWYKNGVEVSNDDDRVVFKTVDGKVNGAISFNPCVGMDAGLYKCTAENNIWPHTASYFIKFQYGPVITDTSNETEIGFEVGHTVTLHCPIYAYPKPSVTWYKNGEEISNTFGTVIESYNGIEGGTLRIRGLGKKDTDLYVCVGKNEKAPFNASYGFDLIENFGPVQTSNESELFELNIGNQVTMTCPIDGFPRPKVKWYKDDVEILNDDERFVIKKKDNIEGGLIRFTSSVPEDQGSYECRFENEPYASRALVFKFGPIVTDTTDRIEVPFEVGDRLNVKCQIDGIPKPNITWFKNNRKIPTDDKRIVNDRFTLTIPNAVKRDQGIYKCNVSDEYLQYAEYFMEIRRRYGPRLATNTTSMTIEYLSGNLLKLYCRVKSFPKPVVTWYKDGLPISKFDETFIMENDTGIQDDTLTFIYLQKKDAGKYECVGRNDVQPYSATYAFNIVETYAPTSDEPAKETMVTLRVGEKITFVCPIYAYPKPEITWYKDSDSEITRGDNVIIESFNGIEDAAMTLISAFSKDLGDYMCVGENRIPPRVAHHVFHLRKEYGPTSTLPVAETTIGFTLGDPIEIRCGIVSHPEPKISWFTHYNPLSPYSKLVKIPTNNSDRFHIKSEGGIKNNVVTIVPTRRRDVGFYSCKGVNKVNPYTLWFKIKLVEKYGPIVHSIEKKSAFGFTVRDKLKVECPISGNPKPMVKWFKNGIRLNQDHRIIIANTIDLYRGSLELTRIVKEDEGVYKCVAENEIRPYNASFTIEIKEKFGPVTNIKITEEHSTHDIQLAESPEGQTANRGWIEYRVGENISVICPIDALPKPKITWYKNGEIMPSPQERISMEKRNGIPGRVLKFTLSAKEDFGFYKCTGENEEIPFTASFTVELRETFAPMIITNKSETRIRYSFGESVTLVCPINSYPKPKVKWYKDGELLTGEKRRNIVNIGSYHGALLKIQHMNNDSGVYECVAENTVRSKLYKTTYTMNLVDRADEKPVFKTSNHAVYALAIVFATFGVVGGVYYFRRLYLLRNREESSLRAL